MDDDNLILVASQKHEQIRNHVHRSDQPSPLWSDRWTRTELAWRRLWTCQICNSCRHVFFPETARNKCSVRHGHDFTDAMTREQQRGEQEPCEDGQIRPSTQDNNCDARDCALNQHVHEQTWRRKLRPLEVPGSVKDRTANRELRFHSACAQITGIAPKPVFAVWSSRDRSDFCLMAPAQTPWHLQSSGSCSSIGAEDPPRANCWPQQ